MNNHGFIALLATIILSLTLTTIMTNISFTSFSHRVNALDALYKKESALHAHSCAEIALLRLARDMKYVPHHNGDDILLSNTSCTIDYIIPAPPYSINDTITIHTHAVVYDAYTMFETKARITSTDIIVIEQREL